MFYQKVNHQWQNAWLSILIIERKIFDLIDWELKFIYSPLKSANFSLLQVTLKSISIYRGSPTYTKSLTQFPLPWIMGDFCVSRGSTTVLVTRFFPSRKMRVKRGPSALILNKAFSCWQLSIISLKYMAMVYFNDLIK